MAPAPRRHASPAGWLAGGLVLLVVVITGCSPQPAGPEAAVREFVEAIGSGDIDAAAELTDRPDQARTAIDAVRSGLAADGLEVTTGALGLAGDSATVDYTFTWHMSGGRQWSYDGQLPLGRRDGRWLIRWSPSDLHPALGGDQTLELRPVEAPRARVNESGGSDVLVPGKVMRVSWSAADVDDTVTAARDLVEVLRPAPTPSAQAIVEGATGSGDSITVAQIDQATYDAARDRLERIPGVTVTELAELVTVDPTFAPDLIGRIRSAVIDRVDGTAGWRVVQRTGDGAVVSVLAETPPEPVPSFSVTLDRAVQVAAQNAVNGTDLQAMTVVLRPSTGAILAVAQNPAADRDGPVALTGQYPPGSTFKIITAGAAIEGGLATPDTPVPCPGELTVGERGVPNYNGFSLGTVPMETAFARSCNTTFAHLAAELPADGLTRAAAEFGIGPSYEILGVPNTTGSVPAAATIEQRAEDGFGQGRVLVSTFGMALAAATVANGSTPVPHLLVGADTTVSGEAGQIETTTVDGLRRMMRAVIVGGTAGRIADQGDVHGKTGEAEVADGSHAWFVGYRGDVAFATLVVRGGSSDQAVGVTRAMFDALPADYGL